jgi:hypothetical protein
VSSDPKSHRPLHSAVRHALQHMGTYHPPEAHSPHVVDEQKVEAGLKKLRRLDPEYVAPCPNGILLPDPLEQLDESLHDLERLNAKMERTIAKRESMVRAGSAFRWIGILLPKRIRDEEVGDALEDIQRIMCDPSCPNVRRAVRWKIVSTWFWLLWHAVGRIRAAIWGKTTG